jgi:hypothetical protein
MSQWWINWLSFIWTSTHDFVYMGVIWLLIHLHIIKPSRALEDRIKALEEKHGL